MSADPLSALAQAVLRDAVAAEGGIAINGKEQKAAAREVVARGFGALNKSASKLTATPAGRFVVGTEKERGKR